MELKDAILGQMGLYVLILLAGVVIHELIHLATAHLLGKKAQLTLTTRGPAVRIPGYEEYTTIAEVRGLRERIEYTAISLAPYALLPLYLELTQQATQPGAKLGFLTLASMHVATLITEFKQDPRTLSATPLLALAAMMALYKLALIP